ncbi:hypothetical protein [Massilia sp. METH4]|uniref:hypothetical protein n=1 Tax=Massilia sp. METH4 TaxID=3123041 RepID=UPI0030CFB1BA
MKALLRTLLLWFLLAAVPFGGFASATMLLCGPQAAGRAAAEHAMGADAHHDHAAMLAAQQGDDGEHHASGASHDNHTKCASPGACCIGAPLAPAPPAAPPSQDGRCATVPFVTPPPAAVDLAGLERPPKSPFA